MVDSEKWLMPALGKLHLLYNIGFSLWLCEKVVVSKVQKLNPKDNQAT